MNFSYQFLIMFLLLFAVDLVVTKLLLVAIVTKLSAISRTLSNIYLEPIGETLDNTTYNNTS